MNQLRVLAAVISFSLQEPVTMEEEEAEDAEEESLEEDA